MYHRSSTPYTDRRKPAKSKCTASVFVASLGISCLLLRLFGFSRITSFKWCGLKTFFFGGLDTLASCCGWWYPWLCYKFDDKSCKRNLLTTKWIRTVRLSPNSANFTTNAVFFFRQFYAYLIYDITDMRTSPPIPPLPREKESRKLSWRSLSTKGLNLTKAS